jgi:hypothetical protein
MFALQLQQQLLCHSLPVPRLINSYQFLIASMKNIPPVFINHHFQGDVIRLKIEFRSKISAYRPHELCNRRSPRHPPPLALANMLRLDHYFTPPPTTQSFPPATLFYTVNVFRTMVQCVSQLLTLFFPRRFFYPEDGGDTFLRNLDTHSTTSQEMAGFIVTAVKNSCYRVKFSAVTAVDAPL